MFKKIYAVLLFVVGGIIGGLFYCVVQMRLEDVSFNEVRVSNTADCSIFVLFVIIFGLIFRIFTPALMKRLKKTSSNIERDLTMYRSRVFSSER